MGNRPTDDLQTREQGLERDTAKALMSEPERVRRTLTDHGRMLWRDDVDGICPSPEICFDYGEHVRCSPCAIKQARQAGVESDLATGTYLPEVARLRRQVKALEEALRPFADSDIDVSGTAAIGITARDILHARATLDGAGEKG